MKYISTRGKADELSFEDVMLSGLARDGGLYVPKEIPRLSDIEFAALANLEYEEIAFRIMRPFVGQGVTENILRDCIRRAYTSFSHPARAPLVQIDHGHFLLELFHGPTLAFKDFAMQVVGQLFQAVLSMRNKRVTIVGATSGDTGSAAIEAFRGLKNVDVFVMYPHDRISDVQRRQMTTSQEANVHALAIDGDFDVCQALLKDFFNDFNFRDEVGLAAINSINWARVLAQIVYYVSAAVSLGAPYRQVSFSVPTGNFGDIFAGFIAKSMGLPIKDLVVATNQNDILHRCLTGHGYFKNATKPSISPSMDIQISSNFERALFFAHKGDGEVIIRLMNELQRGGFHLSHDPFQVLTDMYKSGRVSEDETQATISNILHENGILLCPHSAIGVRVGKSFCEAGIPMISLATAHPAKFPKAVQVACGVHPSLPARMADLQQRPERVIQLPNDSVSIQSHIRRNIAK
ncbi:MAG: threonine synthase [Aestuariivita sp.]|nr:threonine synthase [Aestuariivita sp.]